MTTRTDSQLENLRIAIGSAAIIAAVAATSAIATLLGLAQMA